VDEIIFMENDELEQTNSPGELSVGECFLQCYYLSQRKNIAMSDFRDAGAFKRMDLRDLLTVKKIADSIGFMRLFFLKNLKTSLKEGQQKHELIDAVLSVMLFELKRVARDSRLLTSKDQLQFKILKYFSLMRLTKEDRAKELERQAKLEKVIEESEVASASQVEQGTTAHIQRHQESQKCGACSADLRPDERFKELYKGLIENILETESS
jgi:hypothetical protein